MPTVIENEPLRPWLPLRAAARRWFATTSAASASQPGSRSANSSPPVRYARSPRRRLAVTIWATERRTSSPAPWPFASLIVLRSSTSTISSASEVPSSRAIASCMSSSSWNARWLPRPVSPSRSESRRARSYASRRPLRARSTTTSRRRTRRACTSRTTASPTTIAPADTGDMGDSTTSGTSTGRTLRTIAPAATRKARRKPASTSLTTDRAAARSSCGCVGGRDLKARGTSCRCLGRDPI